MPTLPTRTTRALLLTCLLAAAACSSGDDAATPRPTPNPVQGLPSSAPPVGQTEVAALAGDRFSPASVTLAKGESILVTNRDEDKPHNFVVDGVGASETMDTGDTFRLQFDAAGTYRFVCTFHEGMEGTVTVR